MIDEIRMKCTPYSPLTPPGELEKKIVMLTDSLLTTINLFCKENNISWVNKEGMSIVTSAIGALHYECMRNIVPLISNPAAKVKFIDDISSVYIQYSGMLLKEELEDKKHS